MDTKQFLSGSTESVREKLKKHMEVLLTAAQLKDKPLEMTEYLRENKKYVPTITEDQLKTVETNFLNSE